MSPGTKAHAVHLLTATGAVLAMLALLAAAEGAWGAMFVWLGAALLVDGIDGPLARHYHVRTHARTINGDLLDLIIDFLTYVVIPFFALLQAGLLPGGLGTAVALGAVLASVVYFSDTRMKTADKSFSGFPACWNMLALVAFAVQPPGWALGVVVVLLAVAMFLPLRFVHPVRTARWRAITLGVCAGWAVLAVWAALGGFALPGWAQAGLVALSAYLLLAGLVQQALAGLPAR